MCRDSEVIEAAYERLRHGPEANYMEDLHKILASVPQPSQAIGTEINLKSTGKNES
jgi:hypothetical protein